MILGTFHINGRVNRHNVQIWDSEHPRQIIEHVRDSPKLNVFAAICRRKLYGPFFFAERTVRGHSYLDMLQNWLLPQLEEDSQDFIFQVPIYLVAISATYTTLHTLGT
jgi:hypothetical protein